MRCHTRNLPGLLPAAMLCALFALPVAWLSPLRAQEAADEAAAEEPVANEKDTDEPAEDAAAMEAPADELADEPEAKPRAAVKPKKPAEAGDEAPPAVPNDPAVLAVLESNPKTPAELLRAINILIELGHAPLARDFVNRLAKAKLDLAAKASLAHQFNSATLLKLARNAELGPTLAPVIDDIFKSADEYRRDPKRLAEWARQLSDPHASVRAEATLALIRSREASVAPLVDILADPKRAKQHAAGKRILVELDDAAVPPLLGVLECSNAALKTQVIEVLGQAHAAEAVAPLLAPLLDTKSSPQLRAAAAQALGEISGHVPNSAEAMRLLEHAASRPLEQSRLEDQDGPTSSDVWHWDTKRKQSVPASHDATGRSLAVAIKLARDLYQLDPENAAHRRLYMLALLQSAKISGGLGKPLPTGAGTAHDFVASQSTDVVEDLLAEAMAKGYLPAATAAAEILGEIGNSQMLSRSGTSPNSLVQAAQSADRRLRFAAIGSIMKLNPTEPFAGSNHVADGLGFFASSFGVARVLVAHPKSREAQQMAGLAAELGYDSDIATNGKRAFQLAVASPDYEYILIHSAIDHSPADVLLAQLRRDRRTALLPVGLIAPLDDMDRVKRFAERSARAEAFLQPQNEPEMRLFTEQVLARAGRAHVTRDERKAQAIAALDWLVALSERPQRVFDLRRQESALEQALYKPELSARAATALGQLGTVKSQKTLLELADSGLQPLAARQAAVAAFASSVRKHGLLLTRDEIMRQYDVYNANAGRDADTHTVLSAILDAFERANHSVEP